MFVRPDPAASKASEVCVALHPRVSYPDVEVEVLVCDRLDVESDGRYSGDDFTDL